MGLLFGVAVAVIMQSMLFVDFLFPPPFASPYPTSRPPKSHYLSSPVPLDVSPVWYYPEIDHLHHFHHRLFLLLSTVVIAAYCQFFFPLETKPAVITVFSLTCIIPVKLVSVITISHLISTYLLDVV